MTNLIQFLLYACLFVAFTDSVTQSEPAVQTSCNNCCQGPTGPQGTPGIPGVPGTNGLPGGLAPKGDQGSPGESIKGERGEKGEPGSPGMKGDRGTKRGNNKGEKGQKGAKHQTPFSAFSSTRNTSFTVDPSSTNQHLPYENVDTNLGDDFDAATGQFTCEIPGIYLFTYSIAYNGNNPLVYLMKNNVHINGLYRSVDKGRWDVSTNSAVLQLEIGDQVWVKCLKGYGGTEIFSNEHKFTTFSGVLLHEV